jgi:hypothetical protein
MNKHEEKLIAIFLKAETDIINELGRLRSSGLVDYHAKAALRRVQAILRQMENDCWVYVPKMVEEEFIKNSASAEKTINPKGYTNAYTMTSTQYNIESRLTNAMMGHITESSITAYSKLQSALLGHREDDIYRASGLKVLARTNAKGYGARKTAQELFSELSKNGVTAYVDKAGRKWSLHTYCSMVARTTNRQAEIMAVLTADETHDLYKISSHGTTCGICAPYEGRVYSKSGKHPVFPPLASAFGKIDPNGANDLSNTYLNIHPNCLHVLMPWTGAGYTDEELKEIEQFSSFKTNPPEIDPRTQKQIERYRKKETDRAKWLSNYRQWERYRVELGDEIPKTFNTFMKYKKLNGDRYNEWKRLYRKALKGAETD